MKRNRQLSGQQSKANDASQATNQRRTKTVYVRCINSNAKISAARKFPNKAVFCIDNVNLSCSVDDMISFVKSLGVSVVSCFEVKPRRRYNESSAADRTAFRLCIDDNDRHRLVDPATWPEYVTISEWYFKSTDTVVKRARVDGDDDTRRDQHIASATVNNIHDDCVTVGAVAAAEVPHDDASCSSAVDFTADDTILAACDMDTRNDGE